MITREDKFKFHMKVLALIANLVNDKDKPKGTLSALARADVDACFLLIVEEQRESAERYGTTLQEFFKEYERLALERYKEFNEEFKEVIE